MTGEQGFRVWRMLRLAPVPLALMLTVGPAATARAQSADDGGAGVIYRLPPVVDAAPAGASPAGAPPAANGALPSAPNAPDVSARLQQLEAQLAQQQAITSSLQAQLNSPAAPAVSNPPAGTLPDAAPSLAGNDTTMTGQWLPNGLTFSSADGAFKFHFGGLVQLDYVAIRNNNPGITPPDDLATTHSVTFRRLRFRAEGTMYENIDWVSEFDIANALLSSGQTNSAAASQGLRSVPLGTGVQGSGPIEVVQPTAVFLSFKAVPLVGNIRIGNQRDWFSLEHIEDPRFLDFMERATIMDAYSGPNNTGYKPGISCFNSTENERANWMASVYKNTVMDTSYTVDFGDHNWIYNTRGTWTPYYDETSGGRYLLHVGLGAEYRTYNTNTTSAQGFDNIRLLSRGNLRTASSAIDPNFADTGNFFTQDQTLIDPELAFQWGSLLIQAEWVTSFFGGAYTAQPGSPGSVSLGKNVMTQGGYVEALYFLTGENRVYLRRAGVFGRTIPLENAFWNRGTGCHGWGAWQVGLRYDWLDLNSQDGPANLNGGNEQDITLGLNWFLNPNARLVVNGVASMLNNAAAATAPGTNGALNGLRFTGDGTVLSLGSRMDVNF